MKAKTRLEDYKGENFVTLGKDTFLKQNTQRITQSIKEYSYYQLEVCQNYKYLLYICQGFPEK